MIQLSRALKYALHFKCSKIYIDKPCNLFTTSLFDLEIGCTCDKNIKTSYFAPWKEKFTPAIERKLKYNNFTEKRELFNKYIRKYLVFSVADSDTSEQLYIHIRNSLKFSQLKNSVYYVQPPLDYYRKIIIGGNYTQINVIYQKGAPCVDYIKDLHSNVKYQSSSPYNDFRMLCNAENLVLGYGTFGDAVVLISSKIKNIYIPDYAKHYNFTFSENIHTHVQELPGYIKPVIKNIKMHMLNYKIS